MIIWVKSGMIYEPFKWESDIEKYADGPLIRMVRWTRSSFGKVVLL